MSGDNMGRGPEVPPAGYQPAAPAALTLRDYFAGQALAGLYGGRWETTPNGTVGLSDAPADLLSDARLAYSIADAMIKAREES